MVINSDPFPNMKDVIAILYASIDREKQSASIAMYNVNTVTNINRLQDKFLSWCIDKEDNPEGKFVKLNWNFTHATAEYCERQYPTHWDEIGFDKLCQKIEKVLIKIMEENKNE